MIIDNINYKNFTLASPIYGEEDYDRTIEELIEEIAGEIINEKTKCIKLEISRSKGYADISTPTIRYILKQ